MTTQKQPQLGEWWQKEDTRVFIIGVKKNGLIVGETECGTLIPFMPIHDWQHLPDCTGWDWQPEVWPQYWTAINDVLYAYCERFEPNKYRMVKRDGTVMSDSPWLLTHGQDRTRLTKEQAEALRDKPQESLPQPSPKRVPVRLWVSHNDGSLDVQYGDDNPSSHMDEYEEIKHDANGFYVEVQQ